VSFKGVGGDRRIEYEDVIVGCDRGITHVGRMESSREREREKNKKFHSNMNASIFVFLFLGPLGDDWHFFLNQYLRCILFLFFTGRKFRKLKTSKRIFVMPSWYENLFTLNQCGNSVN
jgi:hypothetical protein